MVKIFEFILVYPLQLSVFLSLISDVFLFFCNKIVSLFIYLII